MADGDELDLLAGEYVLGVLSVDERAAVERRMLDHPELARLVAEWQERLVPLSEDLAPLTPRPQVWQRLRQSMGARQRTPRLAWWERVGIWRGWAAAATVAALGLSAMILLRPPATPQLVAVLNDNKGQPVWVVRATADDNRLLARTLTPGTETVQVPELWLLPQDGRAPVSLGVLQRDASNQRPLAGAAQGLLEPGAALAVSLEPVGGSPTGQPTGPVISTGVLVTEPF